jgi:hypothetical protein
MNDKQTIRDFLKSTRKLGNKTVSGYNTSIKKLSGATTMEEFKTWSQEIKSEDLIKNIKDATDKNGTPVGERTKINYYKALKSIMRLPHYPSKDCKAKAKAEGKSKEEITACDYLEDCEELCKKLDVGFDDLNTKDVAVRKTGEKSQAQEKNMCNWEEINYRAKLPVKELKKMGIDIQRKGINLADDEVMKNRQLVGVQRAVLAHLYGGITHEGKKKIINPPRRTEYLGHIIADGTHKPMRWGDVVDDSDKTTNILKHIKDKSVYGYFEFHLHHHKENEKYGTQIIKIQDKPTIKLLLLLRKWSREMGNNDECVFLRQQAGDKWHPAGEHDKNWQKPLTPNNLINILYSIFNHNGKIISVDILRHCWKTSKFAEALAEYKEDCEKMGHSEEVGKQYVKYPTSV